MQMSARFNLTKELYWRLLLIELTGALVEQPAAFTRRLFLIEL